MHIPPNKSGVIVDRKGLARKRNWSKVLSSDDEEFSFGRFYNYGRDVIDGGKQLYYASKAANRVAYLDTVQVHSLPRTCVLASWFTNWGDEKRPMIVIW